MADTKLADLTSGTAEASDIVYAVKDPSGTPLDRKIALSSVKALIVGAGSVAVASGKTLTVSNTLTFAGTDSTTMTFPSNSATIARTDAAQSFTGNQTLLTSNLVVGTSGKGIDFSANTNAAGMTSELLTWYEEGTWTPVITSSAGTITSYTSGGYYTRVGRSVTINGWCQITNAGSASGTLNVAGYPFTSVSFTGNNDVAATGVAREFWNSGQIYQVVVTHNSTTGYVKALDNNAASWAGNSGYAWSLTYQCQ